MRTRKHTRTHTQGKKAWESSSTFHKGENEAQCRPALTATQKLNARWETEDQA